MDFEAAVITKILKENLMEQVFELNISEDLFPEYRKHWKFIQKAYLEHSGLPTVDMMSSKFEDFSPQTSDDPLTLLVEELKKRYVRGLVIETMTEQAEILKKEGDPYKAIEVMRKAIFTAEEAARSSRDYLVTANPISRIDDYNRVVEFDGMTGVPSPWSILDEETGGFQDEDLIMIAARGGVGKCIDSESLIQDPITGVVRTIEKVVKGDQRSVVCWDKTQGIIPQEIGNKVDTGYKKCFTFSLETGREVTVTPEHPFLTPDGWIAAELLDEGDYVAIPKVVPFAIDEVDMPPAEVDLLAILLSEGTYSGNHVGFSSSDEKFISLAEVAGNKFGVDVRLRQGYEYDFCVRGVSAGRHTPNSIRRLLQSHGMDRKKAIEKTIPEAVFSLGPEQLARFLAVFWMADGYVDRGAPCITLASKKMVYQIQHLLLRFRIQSSVRYKPIKNGKYHSWRLRVYAHSLDEFNVRIASEMWGDKLTRIKDYVKFRSERRVNPNFGGSRWRNPLPELRQLDWVKIEEVSDAGVRKIYDLSVSPQSCFIANDILVHNTWCEVVCAEFQRRMGHPTVIFSKEMSVKQIVRRFDAIAAKINFNRLRMGQLTTEEFERYKETLRQMKDTTPMIISGDIDTKTGVSTVAAKIDKYRPAMVWIDGVYMLRDERRAKASWEKFTNICEDLKSLCQKKRTPIGVSHQFNLAGKEDKGDADTLKYGDVQMWFDVMLGLYQTEDLKVNNEMLFKINKLREGRPFQWVSAWDLNHMDFEVKASGADDIGEDYNSEPKKEVCDNDQIPF